MKNSKRVLKLIAKGFKKFYKELQLLAAACPKETRWNA